MGMDVRIGRAVALMGMVFWLVVDVEGATGGADGCDSSSGKYLHEIDMSEEGRADDQ